jgi:hypothetical protein
MSPTRLASRNPFESVILTASVFSIPGALGIVPPPPSVVAQIGPSARLWLIVLSVSAAIALFGLALESPRKVVVSVNGLLFEQIGVFAFGWSCVFYAAAAVGYGGWPSLAGSGLLLGLGFAGFWQAWKIENVLRTLRGKPQLYLLPARFRRKR